jgi:hypothetical protein
MTAALPILAALGLGLVLMQNGGATAMKRDGRETQFAQYLVLMGSSLSISLESFSQALQAMKARHPNTTAMLNTAYYTFISDYQKQKGVVDVSQADAVRAQIAKYFVILGESLLNSPSTYQHQLSSLQAAGMNNAVASLIGAYQAALAEIKA